MSLELAAAVFIVGGLTLYLVLGGADFGAGTWEAFLAIRGSPEESALVNRAIGPIWEANHVWLVFVLVVLHTAFPVAYSALFQAVFVPLLLGLTGIVLRGAGFAFRYYGGVELGAGKAWGRMFQGSSVFAPFFIGTAAGAVASGELAISADGQFQGSFLTGWISPLSIYTGLLTVAICAYLAGVYLTRDAREEGRHDASEQWRRRSIAAGVFTGALALFGLVVFAQSSQVLREGFMERAWPVVVASVALGLASLWLLRTRRLLRAGLAAAGAAATVLWGWPIAHYPLIVPPDITLEQARASDPVMAAVVISVIVGAAITIPALAWMFYLFKIKNVDTHARE
ncbi:MAG: cytochrome d ubiquinol oxidase subunit II [Chloroflexota bacterium]